MQARKPLTARQSEVLALIRRGASAGLAPSYREIATHLKASSPNGAYDHVTALARKGYVTRGGTPGKRALPIASGVCATCKRPVFA